MKKYFSMSGGGVRGISHIAIWERLTIDKGISFDGLIGNSIGSLLAIPLFLGKVEECKNIFFNLTNDTFWSIPPTNKKGKFHWRALWNLLLGKRYLGANGKLRKLIIEMVSENDFAYYSKSGVDVWICYVDFNIGKVLLKNARELTYKQYIDAVMASSSIPVYTPGVVSPENHFLYDGGVLVHNAGWMIMDVSEPALFYSSYLRPEKRNDKIDVADDALSILTRSLDLLVSRASRTDALLELKMSRRNNHLLSQIYCSDIIKDVYSTNHGDIHAAYISSRNFINIPDPKVNKELLDFETTV